MDKILKARLTDQISEMSQALLWTLYQIEAPKKSREVFEGVLKMIEDMPNILSRDGFFESVEQAKIDATTKYLGYRKRRIERQLVGAITEILEKS